MTRSYRSWAFGITPLQYMVDPTGYAASEATVRRLLSPVVHHIHLLVAERDPAAC